MNELIELLKYSMPALIVLCGMYLMLRHFNSREKGRFQAELLSGNAKQITPVRLQAYERLSLLLERIHPESLIQRLKVNNMTAQQAKTMLLQTIRDEFDHNLSQQIYIGSTTWQTVRNAKEQVIRIINLTASEVDPKGLGILFFKTFLEKYNELQTQPLETAKELLKKEVRQYYSF